MAEGQPLPGNSCSKSRSSCQLKPRQRMHAYEENSLSFALESIRDGKLSLSGAARLHNIPKSTLRSRLRNRHPLRPSTGGAEPALMAQQERDIVRWLNTRHAMGATVGWPELAETVRMYAISSDNGASTSKAKPRKGSKFGSKLPTYGWLVRFKRRHSNVPVLRTKQEAWFAPQLFSSEVMDDWIRNLFQYLQRKKSGFLDFFKRSQNDHLFYLGSLSFVSKKSLKSLNPYEVNVTTSILDHSKRLQILICYTASGRYMRPVFCGAGFDSLIARDIKTCPAFDAIINDQPAINNVVFLSWLNLFIDHFSENTVKPMLILLDRNLACVSMEALKLAEENGVLMYCFPLHSECEQPGKFGVINKIRETLMNYDDHSVTQSKLASKIQDMWLLHSTPQNAIDSFLETGLLPLRDRFSAKVSEMSNSDRLEQPQCGDKTTAASIDYVKGMEHALHIIEQKCVTKEYLPLYKEFYSKGSMPNCDPTFNIWKMLTQEIDQLKKPKLQPSLASVTQTKEKVVSQMSCTDSIAPDISMLLSAEATINDTSAVHTPTRVSVPIGDRYRREFNFDAMPALNLEQHALEIMERYKSLTNNSDLEHLIIDDITDFGGDVTLGNNLEPNNQNGACNS